ncbi:MAG: sarcosine oxidase subunit alpha family protein [Rhodoferax sp.]|nr:sarcosine oxidase subunit alpha family protein [Rhodoferax sp.]
MSTQQDFRLPAGGRVVRDQPLGFHFDGKPYQGLTGDTLASALLANGVTLFGRSFKYHRRRGVYSAGPEEPSALLQLHQGARTEPNTRATMVELVAGMQVKSQNRWPSLAFDWRAINETFSWLMPSGFYYKTFMWPPRLWMFYESQIRKAAGFGVSPLERDPDHYAVEFAHCDVLVAGSGAAGLSAALAAARSGARVVLADERAELGGSLLWEHKEIAGQSSSQWAQQTIAELASMPNVRLLPRSTVFGVYDHNLIAIAERVTDHLADPAPGLPRQRLIQLRARQVVMATGSIERPLVFADNDKPGVMLASAIRTYANQYAVLPGRRVAIFTNNDDAYRSALDAKRSGAQQVTVIDSRASVDAQLLTLLAQAGIGHHADACIAAVHGRAIESVDVVRRDGTQVTPLACDLLGSSGGWSPTVHLYSQGGGKLRFDDTIASFVPRSSNAAITPAGAANGEFSLGGALAQGHAAGAEAARLAGCVAAAGVGAPPACEPEATARVEPMWQAPRTISRGKRFVDIQDDVTVEDIELAHRENFRSVEHLKRYTTLGMGTDQGKTSNVNGLAILAELRGEPIPAVGTTTFRPPFTPVTLGLFAGAETGKHQTPVRRTALHAWHLQRGATMTTVGHWMRPMVYQREGESFDAAWRRESLAVRNDVGLVDVGTLGKIDVQGPDALDFLQRVYCNNFANLAIGKLRYGLMLREDGIVMDDGTVARLSDQHYLVTTTTVNGGKVLSHFEWLLQVAWPGLKCHAVSVTEQFAQFALAGPKSRDVLAALLPDCDVSDTALPHLGILQTELDGQALSIYRMSFSGERAYEIAIGADCGEDLWTRLMACGEPFGITSYGTEAMGVLRIEKGHVAGGELDGRVTAADLGLGKLVRKAGGFVGAALAQRSALVESHRPSLVGLVPVDNKQPIRSGSQLIGVHETARPGAVVPKQGFVSSATPSALLGHSIALAFLENGGARLGQELIAASPLSGESTRVRVVSPVFVDAEHTRLKG